MNSETPNDKSDDSLVPTPEICSTKLSQQINLPCASPLQNYESKLDPPLQDDKIVINASSNQSTDELSASDDLILLKNQFTQTHVPSMGYKWSYKCDYCFHPFYKRGPFIAHYYKKHLYMLSKTCSLKKLLMLYNNPRKNVTPDSTDSNDQNPKFSCEVCKRDFKEQWLLQLHELSHTPVIYTANAHLKTQKIIPRTKARLNKIEKNSIVQKYLPLKAKSEKVPILNYTSLPISIPNTYNVPTFNLESNSTHMMYQYAVIITPPNVQSEKSSESVRNIPSKPNVKILPKPKVETNILDKKKYVCEICNESFAEQLQLQMHNVNHGTDMADKKSEISSEMFPNRNKLTKHKSEDHPNQFTYACSICSKVFRCRKSLEKHKSEVHLNQFTYTCNMCPKRYRKSFSLKNHMKIHTEKPYTCSVCQKSFLSFIGFKNHCEVHKDGFAFKTYQCNKCDLSFPIKKSLVAHYATHFRKNSGVKKEYNCTDCDRTFRNNRNLKDHLIKHTGETPSNYFCTDCGKSFRNFANKKRHELIHLGKKFYTCEICKKGFDRKQAFLDHLNTHSGATPYECTMCSLKFCQKIELTKHTFEHTGIKPYSCEICQKQFGNKGGWRKHVNEHLNVRNYPCTVCEKTFLTSTDLKKHCRSHTGEKPYVCEVCNKGLTSKYALKIHCRIHTGEKPFKCDTCQKAFRVKKCFVDHFKTHPDCKAPSTS